MTKVSLILPVYNVAEYLPMCLESIINQPFKDIEIICVNDGSTDNSLEVLNNFKREDNRIIIIDKNNEGSGVARNTGMKIAQGDYIYFVDADDWLEEDALTPMIEKADKYNTDILVFAGSSCYVKNGEIKKTSGGYSLKNLPKKYFNCVFSAKDIKKDLFKFPATAWTKLYRHEFLEKNKIVFQVVGVGQDQLPYFHSMITAERIAVLDKPLYCYRKNRVGSAMTVKKKKNFSPIYVFYAVEELLNNLGLVEDYRDLFINKYFSKATSWLGKFDDDLKQSYFEEYCKMLKHIQETYSGGWWIKFNPKITDSYWQLKIKQFIAKRF